ncbi:hypothetical protein [Bradyrhizobium sp. 151]|uniref:hypothetical protein n=1 Tax=Bradyrhizobium sp. 151 TaxID=2782626 RepID=UPI001FFAE062|nr:hypothetical protein [Bradyrhizobium sp. 151]MCK1658600.1 hypothetical protein [Bradyrhizobium sp. 151]
MASAGQIVFPAAACGWSTFASSEPPAEYPSDKSAWQVTFEKGRAERSSQNVWLDMCAAALVEDPYTNVDIVSYGDLGEPVEANVLLAQKRGEWVLARIRSAVIEVSGRVLFRGSSIDPRRLRVVNRGGSDAGRDNTQVEIFYR